MAYFSNTQKAKCVLWLTEYKNIQTVQKKLQQEYYEANPDAKEITIKLPSEEEIRQWYAKFKETGSVNGEPRNSVRNRKLSGRKSVDLHATIQRVLSGRKSSDFHTRQHRRLSSQSSLDIHTTIYEKETGLLNFFGFKKIHKCHPYKMRLDNELDGSDIAVRKKFAKNELDRLHRTYNPNHRTWFGGEATFYTNGRVECHNLVYLSEDPSDPESDFPPPRTDSCVTVLAALNSENLLGPYIFADKTDMSIYQIFLRKFVFELRELQQVQTKLANAIFMHDDSPAHEDAKEFLDEEFPEYWVGPGSKHAEWPSLSPDLQPLCFFLWGHIKHKVYETPIEDEDVNELVLRIHHAFAEIMPEMLESAVKAYKERLKMVIEEDGDLVDVLEEDEFEPAPIYPEALRKTH